jgi:hypothetical protein
MARAFKIEGKGPDSVFQAYGTIIDRALETDDEGDDVVTFVSVTFDEVLPIGLGSSWGTFSFVTGMLVTPVGETDLLRIIDLSVFQEEARQWQTTT